MSYVSIHNQLGKVLEHYKRHGGAVSEIKAVEAARKKLHALVSWPGHRIAFCNELGQRMEVGRMHLRKNGELVLTLKTNKNAVPRELPGGLEELNEA